MNELYFTRVERENESECVRERETDRQTDRQTLLHKDKDLSTSRLFNLSLMTNTATLNTSNKNTNNYSKMKYGFKKIKNKS